MNNKNFLISFLMFLLSTFCVFSQSGNAKSLEIGNKWVYERWIDYGMEPSYFNYSVIGDTMINGIKYAVVKHSYESGLNTFGYERADSIKIYNYNTNSESEIVRVNFAKDDTSTDKYWTDVDTVEYWGKLRIRVDYKSYNFFGGINSITYMEGIGLTDYSEEVHGADGWYYLKAAILDNVIYGDTILVDVKSKEISPNVFQLFQNYPNPFNPRTTIRFKLPERTKVVLSVFSITGEKIRELINEDLLPGSYKYEFEGTNLSSGIYFYQLKTDNFVQTKKLVLLK